MNSQSRRSGTKSTIARLVVTLAIALAGFACAAPGSRVGGPEPEVAVGQEAAGSAVSLVRGQRLTISLPGNPTTGYAWETVSGGQPVLEQLGTASFTPDGGALGAGGMYRFSFSAAEAGKAQLSLAYRRGFEAGAPAKSFQLTVVVAE